MLDPPTLLGGGAVEMDLLKLDNFLFEFNNPVAVKTNVINNLLKSKAQPQSEL